MCNEQRPATEQEIKDALLEVLIRKHLSTCEPLPLKEAAEKVGCNVEEVRLVARPIAEKIYTEQIYNDDLRKYMIVRYC